MDGQTNERMKTGDPPADIPGFDLSSPGGKETGGSGQGWGREGGQVCKRILETPFLPPDPPTPPYHPHTDGDNSSFLLLFSSVPPSSCFYLRPLTARRHYVFFHALRLPFRSPPVPPQPKRIGKLNTGQAKSAFIYTNQEAAGDVSYMSWSRFQACCYTAGRDCWNFNNRKQFLPLFSQTIWTNTILSLENFLRWLKRFIIAEFDSVTPPCCSPFASKTRLHPSVNIPAAPTWVT